MLKSKSRRPDHRRPGDAKIKSIIRRCRHVTATGILADSDAVRVTVSLAVTALRSLYREVLALRREVAAHKSQAAEPLAAETDRVAA